MEGRRGSQLSAERSPVAAVKLRQTAKCEYHLRPARNIPVTMGHKLKGHEGQVVRFIGSSRGIQERRKIRST